LISFQQFRQKNESHAEDLTGKSDASMLLQRNKELLS